jgi:hypothetical protein
MCYWDYSAKRIEKQVLDVAGSSKPVSVTLPACAIDLTGKTDTKPQTIY